MARRIAFGLAALTGCTSWGPYALSPYVLSPPVAAEAPTGAVVVTFGDSVPAGTACDCVPFPTLYAHEISPGGQSANLAQPGSTSTDVRSQVKDPAIAPTIRSAAVIILMIGANDLADDFDNGGDGDYRAAADQVETNVAATLDWLRHLDGPSVPILVLGYWNVVEDGDVAQTDYGTRTAEADRITGYVNNALRTAANARSARYVPTLPAFKGDDGKADPTKLLADDGDHPNAGGHVAIASTVFAAQPTPR